MKEHVMRHYGTSDEYSTLKAVIICPPVHFEIKEPINVVQAKWHKAGRGPDPEKGIRQYAAFKHALTSAGVDVWEIPPSPAFTYQVFTRDTGVVTNHGIFIANHKFEVRKGEEKEAALTLKRKGIEASDGFKPPAVFEGGDFLWIDNETILLGIGERTNTDALEQLRQWMPAAKIHPVYLPEGILHLDVVLNIVSDQTALAFTPAVSGDILSLLDSRGFTIIDVSPDEQETMGTNALAIGNKKVIAAACNRKTNDAMTDAGVKVIEIEMAELLKGGGGPRCMTLPVLRG